MIGLVNRCALYDSAHMNYYTYRLILILLIDCKYLISQPEEAEFGRKLPWRIAITSGRLKSDRLLPLFSPFAPELLASWLLSSSYQLARLRSPIVGPTADSLR